MEAYEDPKPMKRLSFKHIGRLLTELLVLLAIYLLGTQLAAWLAWPIPGGVMGLACCWRPSPPAWQAGGPATGGRVC
jgi:hypothetical protein